MSDDKKLNNKFVLDGDLTEFDPKEGQYGNYAFVKILHNKQVFSAMATGDSVERLKKIITTASRTQSTPRVSVMGFLQMRDGKKGGSFLNLRVIDAKEIAK